MKNVYTRMRKTTVIKLIIRKIIIVRLHHALVVC
jgi:hypothetical protein